MMNEYQAKIENPADFLSNNSLRATVKMHKDIKEISKKKRARLAISNKISNLDKFNSQIVAKKSFFLNPSHNNPKIIKTEKKLYVI